MLSRLGMAAVALVLMVGCGGATMSPSDGPYAVGGTVTGVMDGGLVLRASGPNGEAAKVIESDGTYRFTGFKEGDAWRLGLDAPPTMQCRAERERGRIAGESVNSAHVKCSCLEGLADCDGHPGNRCETTLATDNAHCGACGNACTGEATCQAGACTSPPPPPSSAPPRSFDVGDGPSWSSATASSCVQACALLFGGAQGDWSCSTSATWVNHYAWYSKLGSSEHCGPTGTPLPEDFAATGPYATAGYSAYVLDWCFPGEGSINYCSLNTAP